MFNKLKFLIIILFLILGLLAYKSLSSLISKNIEYFYRNPKNDPIQENIISPKSFVLKKKLGEYTITPMAKYKIAAKVMSKRRYYLGWKGELVPFDLALAWGKLIEPENKKYIRYFQFNRWYFYSYKTQCLLKGAYIAEHSANNHILPANANILKAISLVKVGQIIKLKGYLIYLDGEVKGKKVFWHSSLTRKDTEGNSCEFFYVTGLQINNIIYN